MVARVALVLGIVSGCHGDAPQAAPASGSAVRDAGERVTIAGLAVMAFPDLASAILATVPAETRVVGFGELHARVDRVQTKSSLATFTAAVPALGSKVSDLVVETWVVDPACGAQGVHATAALETAVKRPEATKTELAQLGDAARAAKIQPRAMKLSCADYEVIAPPGRDPDPVAMLTITTRELDRVAAEALATPTVVKGEAARPWIALYGGALHNDRFPEAGVEEWSYAAALDQATKHHYVEVDLVVPELAEQDLMSQRQPWFPLVATATRVLVWPRGERSFVMILPRRPAP